MSSPPQKPTSLIHAQASGWVTRLHSGDCTAEQQHEFAEWIACSEAHQQAYSELEAFWQELDGLENVAQQQLNEARAYLNNAQRQPRRLAVKGWAVAAGLLLLVSVPIYQACIDVGVYRSAKGEQRHIQLSDGSRIDLNTNSELRVGFAWPSRSVTLITGEAYFTVTHNPDKPFEVVVADGVIRDIGTQFNVYRQDDQVSVTVVEGEVSVSRGQTTKAENLSAGMQLSFRNGEQAQPALTNDPENVLAWRENRLVFKGQSLATVLSQLERYHEIRLFTHDSKLRSLRVSGSFPTNDLELALNTIAATLPVNINRLNDREIVLVPDKTKQ